MPTTGTHVMAARRHRRAAVAVATALLMLAASACASSSEGGGSSPTTTAPSKDDVAELLGPKDKASGDPIKIGFIGDGATDAFDNTSEFKAAEATAEYWNEHKGGIDGRPVEIVTCATKGDAAGGTDCGNKMVQEGVIAVGLSQSSVTESAWAAIHEAGIPMMLLGASGQELLEDAKSTYNLNNGFGTLFAVPVAVAKDNDIKHITFVTIDVPQALAAFEEAGPALLKEAGIEYDNVKIAPGTADMSNQMQAVADGPGGLVHVVGNDSFCIAAFNGLKDAAFDGEVTSITQCITDATREQAAPEVLDGMHVTALTTIGDTEDPGYQLYDAVMRTYGDLETINEATPMQAYTTTASLLTSLVGLKGKADKDTANAAIKAMETSEIPGAGGMEFKCDGTANESLASVCSGDTLSATLDSKGNPKSYAVTKPLNSED